MKKGIKYGRNRKLEFAGVVIAFLMLISSFGVILVSAEVDDTYSKALLHFTGADTSTTITDESTKVWYVAGDAQIDTSQYKFNTSSLLLDGTGDYIYSGDSADWVLDGGSSSNSWTVDAWVRFDHVPATDYAIISQSYDVWNWIKFSISGTKLQLWSTIDGSTYILVEKTISISADTWYHVAYVRDGSNGYKFFLDGVQQGSTTASSSTYPDYASSLFVGWTPLYGAHFDGWIDELRITKGVARWTSDFTPPSSEYQPPTPTPTNTNTFTPTFTPTSTATFTPTFTPTSTATFTPTFTPTSTATDTPTPTPTPTIGLGDYSEICFVNVNPMLVLPLMLLHFPMGIIYGVMAGLSEGLCYDLAGSGSSIQIGNLIFFIMYIFALVFRLRKIVP